jgi:small subunit ribosomal protein S17
MPKRVFTGVVYSVAGTQTVVVKVRKHRMHPKYKKTVVYDKKYMAHDPQAKLAVGDKVSIEESPPISKMKKWVVLYNVNNN